MMADISLKVTTPKVPEFLGVKMPGAERATRVAVSQFTKEELEEVAEDWKKQLVAQGSGKGNTTSKDKSTRPGPSGLK